MNLFVLDGHSIYRRGLTASLELLAGVDVVACAGSVREAWEDPALFETDLVLLDGSIDGGNDFIGSVGEATGARVIVCLNPSARERLAEAVRAGAAGVLDKESLTPEALAAAVHATATGAGVVTHGMLASFVDTPYPGESGGVVAAPPTPLTDRERHVLSLIADGLATREVAIELSYSERTVKNVLHDVVTKLNARSRSHAVAHAVRQGLI